MQYVSIIHAVDLNNAGLFIRGGPDNNVAGTVQGDAVHEHHHVDSGHTHQVWRKCMIMNTWMPVCF